MKELRVDMAKHTRAHTNTHLEVRKGLDEGRRVEQHVNAVQHIRAMQVVVVWDRGVAVVAALHRREEIGKHRLWLVSTG